MIPLTNYLTLKFCYTCIFFCYSLSTLQHFPLYHFLSTFPCPASSVVGYPGNYQRIGRLRLEECATYGCFLEVTIQLAIILCGKQILYNAIELGIPLLKWIKNRLLNLRRKSVKGDIYTRWERDFDLPAQDRFGLLPEYLEEVIQFGFVTIFVASFPVAPLFALLNNWVEIRLDAYKYIVTQRRPVAERAQDIGAWYSILEVVAKLAVITNVSPVKVCVWQAYPGASL